MVRASIRGRDVTPTRRAGAPRQEHACAHTHARTSGLRESSAICASASLHAIKSASDSSHCGRAPLLRAAASQPPPLLGPAKALCVQWARTQEGRRKAPAARAGAAAPSARVKQQEQRQSSERPQHKRQLAPPYVVRRRCARARLHDVSVLWQSAAANGVPLPVALAARGRHAQLYFHAACGRQRARAKIEPNTCAVVVFDGSLTMGGAASSRRPPPLTGRIWTLDTNNSNAASCASVGPLLLHTRAL